MKKPKIRGTKLAFIRALISFLVISVIVIGVSIYLLLDGFLIGPGFLILGIFCLIFSKIVKININSIYPDIIFGVIDNGVLVFAAVIGGNLAGIPGAILGGAVGNTVTDGIGGLFEGYVAEHQRKFKIDNLRTAMSTMLGKMTGCLLGAGLGFIVVWLLSLI